jgi:hypothetical protein
VAAAFCAFSYAGSLCLVTTVDATAIPDVDRLITGMRHTWDGLLEPKPAMVTPRDFPSAAALTS